MYTVLLSLHSIVRWLVLITLAGRAARAAVGVATGAPISKPDRINGLVAMILMDVQLTLGLALYMVSPTVQHAMHDMGAAMKDPILRFFAVEHVTMMVLAVVGAHVAHTGAKRAKSDAAAHKIALAGAGVALLLSLAGIPWPFRAGLGRSMLTLPF